MPLTRSHISYFLYAYDDMTHLVWVLLAVHNGLSLAITPKSKSTSASTITGEVAVAETVAEADCFFARFLFFSVCVSVVLLRGDTVVCVVLLYLDDSVCVLDSVTLSNP